MLLYHHSIPFSTRHLQVILCTEDRVASESLFTFVCPIILHLTLLFMGFAVHGLCVIHTMKVGHGLYWEEDNLAIGIAHVGRQCCKLLQGPCFQGIILVADLLPLSAFKVVCVGIKHLCRTASGILAACVEDAGSLFGIGNAERLAAKLESMVGNVIYSVFTRIPSHVKEHLYWIFHWLKVADVEYPKAVDAVFIGKRKLFPHVLCWSDI